LHFLLFEALDVSLDADRDQPYDGATPESNQSAYKYMNYGPAQLTVPLEQRKDGSQMMKRADESCMVQGQAAEQTNVTSTLRKAGA